jgi:ornithine carbamoyltransferase
LGLSAKRADQQPYAISNVIVNAKRRKLSSSEAQALYCTVFPGGIMVICKNSTHTAFSYELWMRAIGLLQIYLCTENVVGVGGWARS